MFLSRAENFHGNNSKQIYGVDIEELNFAIVRFFVPLIEMQKMQTIVRKLTYEFPSDSSLSFVRVL